MARDLSEQPDHLPYPRHVGADPGVDTWLQPLAAAVPKRHDAGDVPAAVSGPTGQGSAGVALAGVWAAVQVSGAEHPVAEEPPAVHLGGRADAVRDERHRGAVQHVGHRVGRVRQLRVRLTPAGDVTQLAHRRQRPGRQTQRLHVRAEQHRVPLAQTQLQHGQVISVSPGRVRAVAGVCERVLHGESLLMLLAGVAAVVLAELDLQSTERRPETVRRRQDESLADQGAAAVMLICTGPVDLDLRLPRIGAVRGPLPAHHAVGRAAEGDDARLSSVGGGGTQGTAAAVGWQLRGCGRR